ncbi:hypothetical protein ACROYT_G041625 [Oculina patagonica]
MGVLMSFGVLFPVIIKRFNSSRQETAWIGSLASSLSFFASPVAGRIIEKFSCRFVTMIGAVISAMGLVLSSFADRTIVYYFAYGVLVGFGACCVRTSSFLVVAKYFHKRRPFATGILTSGAGLGLFVLAPITRVLLDNFGLDSTLRFLAGIVFLSGISALAYDPNVEENDHHGSTSQLEEEDSRERGKARIVDCSVWTVPTFTVFAFCLVMEQFGKSITSIHLVKYSEEQGISSENSSRLLMFFGLASCFARLLSGRVCDLKHINPRFVFQVGSFTAALSTILLPLARSYSHFLVCSVFFGLGGGTTITTGNLIFLTCVDKRRRASAFGLASFLGSFSILSSAPLAGFLADELESYAPSFYLAGSTLILCAVLPFVLLCVKVNRNDESDQQEMIAVENVGQIQYLSSC